LKFVATADKAITDESLKELKEQLKTAREGILTVQALKYVESDDAGRAEKAFAFLTKLRDKNPFDPAVLYGLARYQEKAKETDEAISLYAELVSLPMLEAFLQRDWAQKPGAPKRDLPSATLAKLWEDKHGKTDGLDEFKDETYRKRVLAFADKPSGESPAGNKLVLCELFTGSSCPPCVGADIATGALEVTYPKTQVIVLRYHQHIPGPDPLTNSDSEDRFTNYYRGQGTPTVLLNGAPVNNVGGYLPNSPDIYRGLKSLINQQLDSKATVQVGVNARVVDGTLQLVANVTGLDQLGDEAKDLRLRVVIAEDEVHFLARNGVRSHEMIVRRMVGGPAGVEPKDGKLSIKEAIPLAELKASLNDYLKKYEESEGIDFPAKPLDLKRLHVVAFVQNDESHEVLQTNAIAVSAATTASNAVTPASGKAAAKKTQPAE
jgi:tetratricopeptide (TPR) repeat protein